MQYIEASKSIEDIKNSELDNRNKIITETYLNKDFWETYKNKIYTAVHKTKTFEGDENSLTLNEEVKKDIILYFRDIVRLNKTFPAINKDLINPYFGLLVLINEPNIDDYIKEEDFYNWALKLENYNDKKCLYRIQEASINKYLENKIDVKSKKEFKSIEKLDNLEKMIEIICYNASHDSVEDFNRILNSIIYFYDQRNEYLSKKNKKPYDPVCKQLKEVSVFQINKIYKGLTDIIKSQLSLNSCTFYYSITPESIKQIFEKTIEFYKRQSIDIKSSLPEQQELLIELLQYYINIAERMHSENVSTKDISEQMKLSSALDFIGSYTKDINIKIKILSAYNPTNTFTPLPVELISNTFKECLEFKDAIDSKFKGFPSTLLDWMSIRYEVSELPDKNTIIGFMKNIIKSDGIDSELRLKAFNWYRSHKDETFNTFESDIFTQINKLSNKDSSLLRITEICSEDFSSNKDFSKIESLITDITQDLDTRIKQYNLLKDEFADKEDKIRFYIRILKNSLNLNKEYKEDTFTIDVLKDILLDLSNYNNNELNTEILSSLDYIYQVYKKTNTTHLKSEIPNIISKTILQENKDSFDISFRENILTKYFEMIDKEDLSSRITELYNNFSSQNDEITLQFICIFTYLSKCITEKDDDKIANQYIDFIVQHKSILQDRQKTSQFVSSVCQKNNTQIMRYAIQKLTESSN